MDTEIDPPVLRVLSWNLFHGKDFPPDPALFTRASRWLRRTEDDGTFLQVNRNLRPQFEQVLGRLRWDLAGLQETPTAWGEPLGRAVRAQAALVLTSRNSFRALRRLGQILNPDLIGSNEGGSNVILARGEWSIVPGSRRELLLNPGSRWEPRKLVFALVRHCSGAEVGAGNVHLTTRDPLGAGREAVRAAEQSARWAGGRPLVVMGDYNLRPARSPAFEHLADRFGLREITHPEAIDHILARGLEPLHPARQLPEPERELTIPWRGDTRRIRLSDHAPVTAAFRVPRPGMV